MQCVRILLCIILCKCLTGIADLIGSSWSDRPHPIPTLQPFQLRQGPVHSLPLDATPLDYFHLFWGSDFFQLLSDQTNLYAEQRQRVKPDRRWYPTTPEEMRAFIGINVMMGIDRKPEVHHYWSTDPFLGNAGIQAVLPRDRFESLTRYLHLSDSTLMPARGEPGYNPLYKIRPLVDLCQEKFRSQMVPSRDLSVDEGMVKYKGHIFFRQYMPKKPIRWGIKVWMLADSMTGYVCNFSVYMGRLSDGDSSREVGLATRVVLDLSLPFQHTNRHLYFDNFYTSVQLVEELLRHGTYSCGTLRANRYPAPLKAKRDGRMQGVRIKAGETKQHQKGSLLITLWFDKRQIALLSTNCNPNETNTVQRRQKALPHVKDVAIPTPVHMYNKSMGGVDLNDQLRSYYPSGRSGKKWWRKVLWYLLDVSICNSFVAEKLSPHSAFHRTRRTQLQFRLELVKQLIGGFCGRKRSVAVKRRSTELDNALTVSNLPGHVQTRFDGRKRACSWCSREGRRSPIGRTPETHYGCSRCGVNLCKGCFLQYHTENIS